MPAMAMAWVGMKILAICDENMEIIKRAHSFILGKSIFNWKCWALHPAVVYKSVNLGTTNAEIIDL